MVHSKILSSPSKAGNNLVHTKQNVVFITDFPDSLHIFYGRHGSTGCGSHNRLYQKCRHRIRTLIFNNAFQLLGTGQPAFRVRQPVWTAVTITLCDMGHLQVIIIFLPPGWPSSICQGSDCISMVALPAADNFIFSRSACLYLVLPCNLAHGFHGLGTSGAEKYLIHTFR